MEWEGGRLPWPGVIHPDWGPWVPAGRRAGPRPGSRPSLTRGCVLPTRLPLAPSITSLSPSHRTYWHQTNDPLPGCSERLVGVRAGEGAKGPAEGRGTMRAAARAPVGTGRAPTPWASCAARCGAVCCAPGVRAPWPDVHAGARAGTRCHTLDPTPLASPSPTTELFFTVWPGFDTSVPGFKRTLSDSFTVSVDAIPMAPVSVRGPADRSSAHQTRGSTPPRLYARPRDGRVSAPRHDAAPIPPSPGPGMQAMEGAIADGILIPIKDLPYSYEYTVRGRTLARPGAGRKGGKREGCRGGAGGWPHAWDPRCPALQRRLSADSRMSPQRDHPTTTPPPACRRGCCTPGRSS